MIQQFLRCRQGLTSALTSLLLLTSVGAEAHLSEGAFYASATQDASPLLFRDDDGFVISHPHFTLRGARCFLLINHTPNGSSLEQVESEWHRLPPDTASVAVAIEDEGCFLAITEEISLDKIDAAEGFLSVRGYSPNPHVDKTIWNSLAPYFLPQDHPMKEALDKIFLVKERVTLNEKSLKKAGFKILHRGEWSKMIVAGHRNLDGYLTKLYTDDEPDTIDWAKCKERVKGAKSAAVCVSKNNWNHLIKVPKKWIYPLPPDPSPPHEFKRKNFILLVEDMHLIPAEANASRWGSKEMNKEQLKAVYWLLKLEGLRDCVYPFNLPFSNDGRIALIDTEFHHEWPVPFQKLTKFLSGASQKYWAELLESGGRAE